MTSTKDEVPKRLGALETTVRSARDVLWATQICNIICTIVAVGSTVIYLKFVLVPLIMAYFLTFLQAPIMDLLENRPYTIFGTRLCMQGYKNKHRLKYSRRGGIRYGCYNLICMGKIPHGIACLVTLLISFGTLAGAFLVIGMSVNTFLEEEQDAIDKGTSEPLSDRLNNLLNDMVDSLAESGFEIELDEYCDVDLTDIDINQTKKEDGHYELEIKVFGIPECEDKRNCDGITSSLQCEDSGVKHDCCSTCNLIFDATTDDFYDLKAGFVSPVGPTTARCRSIDLFGSSEGYTVDEVLDMLSSLQYFVSDCILVLLLTVYILLERPEGATISGDFKVAKQCEAMCKAYVSLKAMISALTGVLVGFFLIIFGVPLAMVFGLMAFLLNFIPNVGSILATLLPLPVIILMDASVGKKVGAFMCPALVQGYVGNALEPVLFGKSLNLTAISILLSLVIFAYLWGICGAIYSVPILGVLAILCHNNEHPLSKFFLKLIRESDEVAAKADAAFEEYMKEEKAFKAEFARLQLEATDQYEAEIEEKRNTS